MDQTEGPAPSPLSFTVILWSYRPTNDKGSANYGHRNKSRVQLSVRSLNSEGHVNDHNA